MRVGTPGFIGERLKEAREARGMSAATLAELLEITRQAVARYESGDLSPSPEIMRKIATFLDLSLHFFLRPITPEGEGVTHFRSTLAATKASRSRAERRFTWLREIISTVRRYVKFPAVNFPDFHPPADPNLISESMLSDLATATRRYWGLGDGPISDVVRLLENNGAIIARQDFLSASLDAFSRWNETDGSPYIILGNDKESAVRSRHDVAHELGHLVLHRNVPTALSQNRAIHSLMESQAHQFAGAFLLPEPTFSADVYSVTLDTLRALKPKWKASIAAMLRRAATLELVQDEQYRKLCISLGRRGWRTREPLDDVLPPEHPKLLERSLRLLAQNELLSIQDIAHEHGFRDSDVEALIGMPVGSLGAVNLPFELLRLPGKDQAGNSDHPTEDFNGDAEILRFPKRRTPG